jgi:3',5'-cyclic AMP phosphodiesterase CpdA
MADESNTPLRFLVLTDLHFGKEHFFQQLGVPANRTTIGKAISDVLVRSTGSNKVDVIVMAGDFFSKDQPTDVGAAVPAVRDLLDLIPHTLAAATPGNHDLSWAPGAAGNPFTFYDLFARAIGLDPYISGALPSVLTLNHPGRRPVSLLVLDSSRVESEEMQGIGYFGPDQLSSIHDLAAPLRDEGHILLATFHHHVLPVWPASSFPQNLDPRQGPAPSLSHTVDGVELLKLLCELNVSAVLHGHEHFPAVLEYENRWWPGSPIAVLAAGSAGSIGNRHFFVLDVDDDGILVRSFADDPQNLATFAPDAGRPPVTLRVV